MNQALWIAKTGLDAQQTRMAVVSNNLANVNTTGFKADQTTTRAFRGVLAQAGGDAGLLAGLAGGGRSLGSGVLMAAEPYTFKRGGSP